MTRELDTLGCVALSHITGEEIRTMREKLKLTQKDFAKSIGIPLSTVRKWEQEVMRPRTSGQVVLRQFKEQRRLVTTK